MTVAFPKQPWHAGAGDHILRASAYYSAWLQGDRSETLRFAIEDPILGSAIRHYPDVEYCAYHRSRHEDLSAYRYGAWGDMRELYQALQLNFDEPKRLYYFVTQSEQYCAERIWSGPSDGRRVCVQWEGGMPVKRYAYWGEVVRDLCSKGFNVIVLDHRQQCELEGVHVCRARDLRTALALAATADRFVGFDSGPFYAALGSFVPSYAIFPCLEPDRLIGPLRRPDYNGAIAGGDPNIVPPEHIVEALLELRT